MACCGRLQGIVGDSVKPNPRQILLNLAIAAWTLAFWLWLYFGPLNY
jgi:hypothetical protein